MFEACRRCLRQVTVEPIFFIYTTGWCIFSVAMTTGLYWKICEQQFGKNATLQANCSTLKYAPEIEAFVQKESALWTFYTNLATLLPTIFAGLFYGAVGDKYGRKWNVVFAQSAMIGYASLYFFEFQFVQLPLLIIPIASAFLALSGLSTTIYASCYAYITDVVKDENLLTIRFAVVDATHKLGDLIFSFVTAFVIQAVSLANAVLIAMSIWFAAVLYALITLKQRPPVISADASKSNRGTDSKDDDSLQPANGVLHQIGKLFKTAIKVLCASRSGHFRPYLLITLIFAYLSTLCHGCVLVAFNLFVMRSPIQWTGYDIAIYNGIHAAFKIVGALIGSLAFKRLLKLHETSIVLIGAFSRIFYALIIGLADSGAMIIIAGGVDLFSAVLGPASTALATQFVQSDEVGTILAILTLAMNLGYATAFGGGSYLYRETLDIFPGFVFLSAAGVFAIAFCLMAAIHFDYGSYRKKARALAEKDSTVIADTVR